MSSVSSIEMENVGSNSKKGRPHTDQMNGEEEGATTANDEENDEKHIKLHHKFDQMAHEIGRCVYVSSLKTRVVFRPFISAVNVNRQFDWHKTQD